MVAAPHPACGEHSEGRGTCPAPSVGARWAQPPLRLEGALLSRGRGSSSPCCANSPLGEGAVDRPSAGEEGAPGNGAKRPTRSWLPAKRVGTYPTRVPFGGVVSRGSSRQSAGRYRLRPDPEVAWGGSTQVPPVSWGFRDVAVPCSCRGHPKQGESGPMEPFGDSSTGESASSGPCVGVPKERAAR